MIWKEFFKPTKWKIRLSIIPLIFTLSTYFLVIYLKSSNIIDKADNLFPVAVIFGLFLILMAMLFPPLKNLFCEANLAKDCHLFFAFPELTLLGSILLGIVHVILVYSFYSLIAFIIKKYKDRKNSFQ